jgi:hypothetical protein
MAFFLLFPSWRLSFLPSGGEKGYQETHICLHQYMGGNWDALQEEHTIRMFTLAFRRHLELILDHTPPPSV